MRARYSAFALGEERFLRDTWNAGSRSAGSLIDPELSWTGLSVTGRSGGGLLDQDGTVEFTARYRRPDGSSGRLRERSRFARGPDGWRYLGPA